MLHIPPIALQLQAHVPYTVPELLRSVKQFLPVLVASIAAWFAVRLLAGRIEKLARYAPGEEWAPAREQRARTLALLLRNAGQVVVVLVGGIMSLRAFGVDTNPLLAVSGVVGLAISFGSQSLVRDYVTGFLLQFEHQFGLGDVVRIGSVEGKVEAITLRLVYIRATTGALDIIPNGQITQVTNLSRAWRRAAVSVDVPWRAAEAAAKSLGAVADALAADDAWKHRFLESPKVTGIEKFGAGTVTLGIAARTVPADLNVTNRELRRRVQAAFQRDEIPVVPIPVVAAATL